MICAILDINIYVTISIVAIVSLVTGGSIVAHYAKNPEKLEKLISLLNRWHCPEFCVNDN
jgi:hypothetical protein